jgi:hypothetical protein
MADYSVLPAQLDLAFVRGDEFNMSIDLSFDGTGYTWSAVVFEASLATENAGIGSASGTYSQGSTAATFSIDTVSAANAQYIISLTEAQTLALDVTLSYRWFFRGVSPGGVTRTYLSGSVSPRTP